MDSTYYHAQESNLQEQIRGIFDKVNRSHTLLADIIISIEEYKRSKACFVSSENRYGMNNRYLVVTKLIDPSVTIKMGKMILCLRSALDHVTYAFWLADLEVRFTNKLAKDVYFPIAETQSIFLKPRSKN